MKIVHVCQYFFENLGYQDFNLAKEHERSGNDVTVITSDRYFPFANYDTNYKRILGNRIIESCPKETISEYGYKVIRLRPIFEFSKSSTLLLPNLDEELERINPDLVILHEFINPNSFSLIKFKRKKPKARVIFDTHAASYNTSIDSFFKRIYLYIWKLLVASKIDKMDIKIVATGLNEKKYAEDFLLCGKSQVKIIELGADTSIFYPDTKKRLTFRHKFGFNDNELIIINAGKINASKKNMELLKAFHAISRKTNNIRLCFVGDGDQNYISKLKMYIKRNKINEIVTFFPMQSNTDLAEFLRMSDIGAWPGSKSNVFIEAMSCGLPLILEKKAYAKALVSNKNGVLCSNEEELRSALSKYLDKDNRKIAGLRSYELAQKKYSWKTIAKAFKEIV